jgi:hypothetical protein
MTKDVNVESLPENENEFEELSLITVVTKRKTLPSLLQEKKGHLVYLMPYLARCISCKDAELKELLKDVFMELSKEMGFEYSM